MIILMSIRPTPTDAPPRYSAEDLENAKKIIRFMDKMREVATNKKVIPIEAEAILQIIKALKVLPVPQLKLICIILIVILLIVFIIYRMALS